MLCVCGQQGVVVGIIKQWEGNLSQGGAGGVNDMGGELRGSSLGPERDAGCSAELWED